MRARDSHAGQLPSLSCPALTVAGCPTRRRVVSFRCATDRAEHRRMAFARLTRRRQARLMRVEVRPHQQARLVWRERAEAG
jgi:hypothetical protein